MNALQNVFEVLGTVVALVALACLISLPGIGITYLGWKVSRRVKPLFLQALLRGGMIAILVTPAFWGHAGVIPAVVLAFTLQGLERLAGIIPIIAVWVVATPILFVRARKRAPITI